MGKIRGPQPGGTRQPPLLGCSPNTPLDPSFSCPGVSRPVCTVGDRAKASPSSYGPRTKPLLSLTPWSKKQGPPAPHQRQKGKAGGGGQCGGTSLPEAPSLFSGAGVGALPPTGVTPEGLSFLVPSCPRLSWAQQDKQEELLRQRDP